jgi:acetylornithine/succinyldiaminopimelate/putrescine aminotransferase
MFQSSLLKNFGKCNFLRTTKRIGNKYLKENSIYNFSIPNIQQGYLNFYEDKCINNYLPVASFGPWIMTHDSDIIYDCGGYGMLGFGHNPPNLLSKMGGNKTMANIMTPSFSQKKFSDIYENFTDFKYEKIMCLNSGSEVNGLACRIANTHMKTKPVMVNLSHSFHGRTEIPSQLSDSNKDIYKENLSDFSMANRHKTIYSIEPNNLNSLYKIFQTIDDNNEFPEITVIEPVMGEGNPGYAINSAFYNKLRQLTKERGGLLLVDSIQAGLRCTGKLSLTSYPGFENCEPPDMETFSKALNGGQYPFSVLALNSFAAEKYIKGLYGNTMTSNPRALDIASEVLTTFKRDKLDKNIVEMGGILLNELKKMATKYPFILNVEGKGLLLSIHIDQSVKNAITLEREIRNNGLNVIHGGENAIRLTPWFYINEKEIELIVSILDTSFQKVLPSSSDMRKEYFFLL